MRLCRNVLRYQEGRMKRPITACIFAGLILTLGLVGMADDEFGFRVTNCSSEANIIVEDFADNLPSSKPFVQTPVQMGYWDMMGSNLNIFDEGDVLYLHIGEVLTGTEVGVNDIRLTNSTFGPPGSKVKAGDGDLEMDLTQFPRGLPRIVFTDELVGITGQFDINDSVYIKTASPVGILGTGDVRLSSIHGDPATFVQEGASDYGLVCSVLHPGPSFDVWYPGARGKLRFFNENGNLYIDPGAPVKTQSSPPIYDEPDDVYFDLSSPSAYPRSIGYITPNAIRLSI